MTLFLFLQDFQAPWASELKEVNSLSFVVYPSLSINTNVKTWNKVFRLLSILMKVLCIPIFHSSCRKCVIALLWCRKVINLVQNKIFSILILKFLVLKKLCFCVLRALNFLLSSFLSIKMCATGLERINSICSAHRNLSELWTWEKCFDSRFQAYLVFRIGVNMLGFRNFNTKPTKRDPTLT